MLRVLVEIVGLFAGVFSIIYMSIMMWEKMKDGGEARSLIDKIKNKMK